MKPSRRRRRPLGEIRGHRTCHPGFRHSAAKARCGFIRATSCGVDSFRKNLYAEPRQRRIAMAPFDMSLVQRGARCRRTPYYEATQRYSPQGFTVYNHMYFPIRFDSFEAEYEALLNGVTLWDVSVERCLEISGPDG